MSRRELLAAGMALAVGASCGNDDKKAPSSTAPDNLEVLVASAQVVAGAEQRLTFGVLRDAEPITASNVRVSFGRKFGAAGAGQEALLHADGIPDKPYYLTSRRFDRPGRWVLTVSAGNRTGTTQVDVIDAATSKVPLPGQPMVTVATPTTADHRGVDPICTRQPACSLHDVSLDAALREGRPLGVLFATPALCESRTCGPVLEVLLSQAPAYADRVRFVHVEVYTSLDVQPGDPSARTEGMKAYHLDFEPILFLAGANGVVRERLDGPFDRAELRGALDRLVKS